MWKGLRRMILLTFLFTILLAAGAVVFANETADTAIDKNVLNKIEKANEYVYDAIDKTVMKALDTSSKTGDSELILENTQKLCDKLVRETDKKVENLVTKAAREDIQIVQEYIEVEICNNIILVDPCFAY